MGSSKWIVMVMTMMSVGLSWGDGLGFEETIRNECAQTRYPNLCVQTLKGLGSNQKSDYLFALVNKTIHESNLHDSYFANLMSSSSDEAQSEAIDYCNELMKMSSKRLTQALLALQKSPQTHKADIQTWLSAALTCQDTCKDAIQQHALSNAYVADVYRKMGYLSQLVSNPLALVNRITATRKQNRRLDEFPSWVNRKLLQSTGVKANAVVAQDGSGDYKTISAAISSAGGGRYVIYVKSGTYSESIRIDKDGITLIGEGKYSTVISGGKSVGNGASLRGSATATITGDGFIARDIGFQNTAGAENHQAVAINVASDHSVFYRCSIAGYQDTLYAHSLRQFYRECDIYGTVDYIFGNAAAVIQSSNLVFRRPRSGGSFNTILANGRTDPGQNTGFTVQNCKITVGSDFAPVKNKYNSYLGRPWKAYSRAVVMQTNIDAVVSSRGWSEWEGSSGSTYKTLYFAEYENMGPGSGTSGRVSWPGFHVLGTGDASKFTVANFIGGNSWLPSTGVAYDSGL